MSTLKPRWVDKNGDEKETPLYVESAKDALKYYASIYDENQTGDLPATIGMPNKDMTLYCYALSEAAEKASQRTKDALLKKV